ncbi:hypothetical protein KP509_12G038400 [Ceratopteris richardii]|nr:hypothetical protein KP509_12G038400 [Ceratopteris richardii]
MDKAAPALEFSKESMDQNMDRNKRTVEPKSLVEREWLANREREKGNDLFKAKEFNLSLKAYTKAIDMYKHSAALYTNRAAVYLKMNRHEEAHADCCEALKLDPMNVKAFMRRAKASFEMSEYMKALNDVKEVLKYNPTNEEALSLKKKVEDVLKKQSGSDVLCEASLPDGRRLTIEEIESDDLNMQTYGAAAKDEQENSELMADDLRVKGNTFFAEKKFEKAHEYYSKSLSYVPDSVTVLCNRALCEIRLKNYEQAEMDASKALAIDPNYAKAFHHRGLARHALGKLEDAMKDLQEVLRVAPAEVSVKKELDTIMEQLNDGCKILPKRVGPMIIEEIVEESTQNHHKGNSTISSSCHEQNLHGSFESQNSQHFHAADECKVRMGIEGNSMEESFNFEQIASKHSITCDIPSVKDEMCEVVMPVETSKSPVFLDNSSHAEAPNVINDKLDGDKRQASSQKCFPLRSSNDMQSESNLLNFQGHSSIHVSLQEPPYGLETKTKLSEENHQKPLQMRLKGNEFYKNGDFSAAIDCYNRSLELDEKVAATYTNRALCYLKLNQPAKAIHDCTKALGLEPNNKKAYFRRAISKKDTRDFSGALEDMKIFVGLCPNDESAQEFIKEIEDQLHGKTQKKESSENASKTLVHSSNLIKPTVRAAQILENPDKWRSVTHYENPRSAIEFERSCLDLLKQPLVLKQYLQAIKTSFYPKIFKEDLTAKILKLIAVFMKENILLFQSKELLHILEGFSRVNRFQFIVMFIDVEAKEAFQEIFDHISMAIREPDDERDSLKAKYRCN